MFDRKAKSVEVMNLATTRRFVYGDITPAQAVQVAYLQYQLGNWNTWTYDEPQVKAKLPRLMIGELTVSCGDFCAYHREMSGRTEF